MDHSSDVVAEAWVEGESIASDVRLGRQPELPCELRRLDFFAQTMRSPAHEEQTVPDEPELCVRLGRELFVAPPARQGQVAQQRRRALDVRARCRSRKPNEPREQVQRQAGLDMEGRGPIEHPLETESYGARRRQGHEMARHDHAGVAERAAPASG
jgi:hypothetical protein